MSGRFVALAVVLALFAGLPVARPGAQSRPLPAREAFFTAIKENLARAQREQGRYAYRERRSELHTNPFGRIGTGGTLLYSYTPEAGGGYTRTLLERDGKAVTGAKPERQERRPRAQTSRAPIDDVVDGLTFAIDRRDTIDGREAVAITFAPRPNAKPQTREGRMARAFSGVIWVDESANEVIRVDATAMDSLSFGFGVVARLNEGTKVSLIRQPIDDQLWLPTSLRLLGEGRAVLFRKLNVDFAIEWFDYLRVP